MPRPPARLFIRERLEETVREIGTLLIAFTPLDAVLWADQPGWRSRALIFALLGVSFLGGALASEYWRRYG